jgi:HK97 family phage prohead protease
MQIQATRRMVTTGGLEVRAASDTVSVEGYAATFDQPYSMGWYSETVAQGAFTRTLKTNPDVRFLINHDGLPLARTTSEPKNLEISQDSTGLHIRSTLAANDPDVQRILPKMQRGDLNQMSFAFGIPKGGDAWSEDRSQRTLTELSLAGGDVSVVTYPANPNAAIALRMQQLVSDEPDKIRELYSNIADGHTDLPEETQLKFRSLLESLSTGEAADSSLMDLSDLLGERDSAVVEELETALGHSVSDIRSLITKARATSRG